MFLPDKNLMPTTETKPAPFTLPSVIAWLETMPSDGSYCFTETSECLWALYGLHLGYGNGNGRDAQVQMFVAWNASEGTNYDLHRLPFAFRDFGNIANKCSERGDDYDYTFGAALERARAYAEVK